MQLNTKPKLFIRHLVAKPSKVEQCPKLGLLDTTLKIINIFQPKIAHYH
jgi:hypothetical protein